MAAGERVWASAMRSSNHFSLLQEVRGSRASNAPKTGIPFDMRTAVDHDPVSAAPSAGNFSPPPDFPSQASR